MKTLILGAKGNLGSRLKEIFSAANNEVIAWDKENIDVSNKENLFAKIKQIKPELIINAVAYNAVDKCEEAEGFKIAKKINGQVPGYLAQICSEIGSILIHYSSDYVFSGKNKNGYKENAKPAPINNYGKTKLMGENEILKRKNNLKYYIIRTSKLFGPKGESEIAKPNFFDIMLNLSQEKGALDVVDEEVSCFTYTKDLAKETKKLIKEKGKYGIYHIVNSGSATWFEATKILFKLSNINAKLNKTSSSKFSRPAKRPKYSTLINTKLKPLRNYKNALQDYLKNKK